VHPWRANDALQNYALARETGLRQARLYESLHQLHLSVLIEGLPRAGKSSHLDARTAFLSDHNCRQRAYHDDAEFGAA
jgi:predicted GTPase